jgi:hypothetical protein
MTSTKLPDKKRNLETSVDKDAFPFHTVITNSKQG